MEKESASNIAKAFRKKMKHGISATMEQKHQERRKNRSGLAIQLKQLKRWAS
jgi:hypothetical protein